MFAFIVLMSQMIHLYKLLKNYSKSLYIVKKIFKIFGKNFTIFSGKSVENIIFKVIQVILNHNLLIV